MKTDLSRCSLLVALLAVLLNPFLPVGFSGVRAGIGTWQVNSQELIRKIAAAESQNRIALTKYAFTQDIKVQTIGKSGLITGEMHRESDISYDGGNRVEKIRSFETPSLKGLTITEEDLRDVATIQSFALTEEDLPKYKVEYKGQERIDELNTYLFEVKPIKVASGERYFHGRIWVDDKDLVIVKVDGQAVSEKSEQRFPHFESYRENVDGKHWFPTYVHSDETINFPRNSVHMKMTIRFTGYHKAS